MLQLLQYNRKTTEFDRLLFLRESDIESLTTTVVDRGRQVPGFDRYPVATLIRLRSGRKHVVGENVESIAAACGAFAPQASTLPLHLREVA